VTSNSTPSRYEGRERWTRNAFDTLRSTSIAAALVHLPDGEVLEMSEGARRLLDADPQRGADKIAIDAPGNVLNLVHDGTLRACDTSVVVTGGSADHAPITAMVHRLSDTWPELAIAMFDPIRVRGENRLAPLLGAEEPAVLGTTDVELHIDRITADAEDVFGVAPDELVGRSILCLIAPEGVGEFLWALAEATRSKRVTCIRVAIASAPDSGAKSCAAIIPLEPAPSMAFAFLGDCPRSDTAALMDHVFVHMAQAIRAVPTASRTAVAFRPAGPLNRLSARELEVAYRLWSGDRVQAIAEALFVSPSTVRNQLSSIYRKLGLGTQQELIDYLREIRTD